MLTRRKLIFGIGTTAALYRLSSGTNIDYASAQYRCALTLDQAKSGKVTSQKYLNERLNCLPEVLDARDSGMLKGFLYNPSDTELGALLRNLLSGKVNEEQKLSNLVQSSINDYKQAKDNRGVVATRIPGVIDFFGENLPQYIAFTPALFHYPVIKNDADVKSIINHELRHVRDWYGGVKLGNTLISHRTITLNSFRIEFLEQLLELRAVYDELKNIFRERVEEGSTQVSSEFFASRIIDYSNHRGFIQNNPIIDLERRVAEMQLEESKGIIPEIREGKRYLNFNLFGKKDSISVRKSD